MLSKILSKETCANCKFCCSFRRCSLWEVPKLPAYMATKYSNLSENSINSDAFCSMDLEKYYQTSNPQEEVKCLFLDSQKGCILPDEDKPIQCKIWPLRVMKKDDEIVLALALSCPAISKDNIPEIKCLLKEGLLETVKAEIADKSYVIEDYRDSYVVIETL